jgi:hypothetical protein
MKIYALPTVVAILRASLDPGNYEGFPVAMLKYFEFLFTGLSLNAATKGTVKGTMP